MSGVGWKLTSAIDPLQTEAVLFVGVFAGRERTSAGPYPLEDADAYTAVLTVGNVAPRAIRTDTPGSSPSRSILPGAGHSWPSQTASRTNASADYLRPAPSPASPRWNVECRPVD